MPFTEQTVYVMELTGEVEIEADNDPDARSRALAYFSQSPQSYIRIKEVKKVQVETE